MIKIRALLFVFLVYNIVYSQKKASVLKDDKLTFTYIKKSKYKIKNFKVYGDSLMFAVDFPNLKSIRNLEKSNSIDDEDSYIYFNKFKKKDKDKLLNILYHVNERIDGEFNVNKNKTTLTIIRDDDTLKEIFKNYFKTIYRKFQYRIIIDYDKKKIFYKYPNVSYTYNFSEKEFKINYVINFIQGVYVERNSNLEEKKLVFFDERLDPKISLDKIFLNQKYGLKKIESVFETVVLLE